MVGSIEIEVNGVRQQVDVEPERRLLTVLRDELDLTGTKYGCGEGQCGACTVLIDGAPARSCQTRVGAMAGHKITTIEGVVQHATVTRELLLHPLQEAFLEVEAMQCGYCTSGMIMSAVALLQRNPAPKENEVIDFMDGNVCRCGTYPRVREAITRCSSTASNATIAWRT